MGTINGMAADTPQEVYARSQRLGKPIGRERRPVRRQKLRVSRRSAPEPVYAEAQPPRSSPQDARRRGSMNGLAAGTPWHRRDYRWRSASAAEAKTAAFYG